MYEPNFNNKLVINKIKKALGFVGSHLSETKPRSWYTRYIDEHFGQQQHQLSKWLRSELLICTNQRYSKDSGICKQYIRNQKGYLKLKNLIKIENNTSFETEFVKEKYEKSLITKDFAYEDKSGRLWHPLQQVRKEYKLLVFTEFGLNYQYDIECCLPTLIYQYSQKLGMDEYLFAINKYINDRKQVRQEIADKTEISVETAKALINALFNGAQLGMNQDSSIFDILNGDQARIEFLKQDPYIIELRNNIKTCWDVIKHTLPRKSITTKTNKQRMLPISSKQKAGVYFELERQVLNSVRNYLDVTNNKYFLEHDGWVCTNEIDMYELIKWVKDSVGYNINLDRSVLYKSTISYPSV